MVIDSSYNHLVSVKFDDNGTKVLHCEVLTWTPTLKERLQTILRSLGRCYTTVDNFHSIKFNLLLGAKVIGTQEGYTILRYN